MHRVSTSEECLDLFPLLLLFSDLIPGATSHHTTVLYSDPPPLRPFSEAKPTLLVSWWITLFCTCIILLRLVGRYIRVEKLFREGKTEQETLALNPLADIDAKWARNPDDARGNLRNVYNSFNRL